MTSRKKKRQPVSARDHQLALSGQPDIYCWPDRASKRYLQLVLDEFFIYFLYTYDSILYINNSLLYTQSQNIDIQTFQPRAFSKKRHDVLEKLEILKYSGPSRTDHFQTNKATALFFFLIFRSNHRPLNVINQKCLSVEEIIELQIAKKKKKKKKQVSAVNFVSSQCDYVKSNNF